MKRWRREWIGVPFVLFLFWTMYYFSPRQRNPTLEVPESAIHYFEVQKPYLKYTADSNIYTIAIVADKDKRSKNDQHWESVFKSGKLVRNSHSGNYSITWEEQKVLTSTLAEAGRSMELSELVSFNSKLLSPDDRTGVVFSIEDGLAIPEYILMDGNGRTTKGFKSEWATVKEGILHIGSVGKEWSDNKGNIINNNPLWIKQIDRNGKVEHKDWSSHYNKLRKAAGAEHPGYLMHEAVCWNPVINKWFFLPRRHSTLPYNDEEDENRGTNLMITADVTFQDIKVHRIGHLDTSRGFSSCAFIPGREMHLIALKSQEIKDTIASYISVYDVENGKVLMEEQYIGDIKFEGVEIL